MDIAFLESELADFFESPGPLMTRLGEGPVAEKGIDFEVSCWLLVRWMREARLVGYVTAADLGIGEPKPGEWPLHDRPRQAASA